MAELNSVYAIGRLGVDPELRYTTGGTAVCSLRLAINSTWMKDGEKMQDTCWIDATCWGNTAETAAKHLAKGKEVLVVGRLRYETWEDQDGGKRSKHALTVNRLQFLGPKEGKEGKGHKQEDALADRMASQEAARASNQRHKERDTDYDASAGTVDDDDDLPF